MDAPCVFAGQHAVRISPPYQRHLINRVSDLGLNAEVITRFSPTVRDLLTHPDEITDPGRAELGLWFTTPVSRTDRPRDELAIKLALALTTPGVDVRAVVQTQRTATMRTLQEYTRLKARAVAPGDLSWRLVLDAMLFQAEAEVRWLDHCEASLVRYTPPATSVALPGAERAEEVLR